MRTRILLLLAIPLVLAGCFPRQAHYDDDPAPPRQADQPKVDLDGPTANVPVQRVAAFIAINNPFLAPDLIKREAEAIVRHSAEREKVVDYVSAYAPYYIAVIGPQALKVSGKEDLADKSIAVNRGTLEDTSLTAVVPASADVRRFDNYNSVIQAFLSGQAQVMVVGNDVGSQVLAKRVDLKPEQKFQLLSSPDHIAINKNEPRLKQALNDAVAKLLADGKLNEISVKWLQKPLDPKDLKD